MNRTSLREAGFRGPVTFQKAPLFTADDAPYARARLAGLAVGDLIWLSVPGQPGQRQRGRVINILQRNHTLVMRVEGPDRIVSLKPEFHGHIVTRRFETGGQA